MELKLVHLLKIRTKSTLLDKNSFRKSVMGDNLTSLTLNEVSWMNDYQDVLWVDPNDRNFATEVL